MHFAVLAARVSNVVKRREAWRGAFRSLSKQWSLTIGENPCTSSGGAGGSFYTESTTLQRAHLHRFSGPHMAKAMSSLASINEASRSGTADDKGFSGSQPFPDEDRAPRQQQQDADAVSSSGSVEKLLELRSGTADDKGFSGSQPFRDEDQSAIQPQQDADAVGPSGSVEKPLELKIRQPRSAIKEDGLRRIVNDLIIASRHNDAVSVKRQMARLRHYPGEMNYSNLHAFMIECRMQPGSAQLAEDFMKLMAQIGAPMRTNSYGCYLITLCQEDLIQKAFDVLVSMADKRGFHPPPTTQLVNTVLTASRRLNDRQVFDNCIQLMRLEGLEPDSFTFVEIIKMAGLKKSLYELRKAWAAAAAALPPRPPLPIYSTLVVELSRIGAVTEALMAFEEMKEAVTFFESNPEGVARGGSLEGIRLPPPTRLPAPKMRSVVQEGAKWREEDPRVAKPQWVSSDNLSVAYSALMAAAAANGELRLLKSLRIETEERGMSSYVSEQVYHNMLLRAAATAGALEETKRLAEVMRKRNFAITPNSYSHWIEAHCKKGELEAAESLLKIATSKKAVQGFMFRTLAHGIVRQWDLKRSVRLARLIQLADCKPSPAQYAALFSLIGLTGLMKKITPSQTKGRIWVLSLEKKELHIKHSTASFHAQMWALANGGHLTEVMQQFRWVRNGATQHKYPILRSYLVYNSIIHPCLRLGKYEDLKEVMALLDEEDLTFDITEHRVLAMDDYSFGDTDLQSAEVFLETLKAIGWKLSLPTFNFLMQVTCHDGELDAAVRLLERMPREGVDPDRNTFMHLLVSSADHGRFDLISRMVEEMHKRGFAPDSDTCLAVVSAYVRFEFYNDAAAALELQAARIREHPTSPEPGFNALYEQLKRWIERERARWDGGKSMDKVM